MEWNWDLPGELRKQVVWSASLDQEECNFKERTHHDVAIETLLTNGDSHILAIIFKDLGARDHETIGVRIGGIECRHPCAWLVL